MRHFDIGSHAQEYMADQLDISLKSYNELETGKTNIHTDRLEQIAKILKTTPEGIYSYQDNFTQNNTLNEQNSKAVLVQHESNEHIKDLYEKLLASKDAQLIEKDRRIVTLEEMIRMLKTTQ